MILSTNLAVVSDIFGDVKGIEMIADAGFDAIDMSLNELMTKDDMPFNSGNYMERAELLLNVAKSKGIVFNQAHAIFPTGFKEDDKTEKNFKKIIKGIEIASYLGAKIIVVHPKTYYDYSVPENVEIMKNLNMDFYASLLPYAKKYGIKIAIENMWNKINEGSHASFSVCADIEEFKQYVDAQDKEYFTACLDVGHSAMVGLNVGDAIRNLGHDRLTALHIHDNDLCNDYHVMPMTPVIGKLNWDEICKALADIDYSGDFTFEIKKLTNSRDERVFLASLKTLCETGRYLVGKIQEYKNN